MSTWEGRPAGNRAADGSDYAGSVGASAPRMTPQVLPAEAVPAQPATRDGLSDHEWLRRAAIRAGHLTAYVVIVRYVRSQQQRRTVHMTLGAARGAASRARGRGHDVEVRLVALLTLAQLP